MTRRVLVILALAIGLALGAVGPAWAVHDYLINYNHVNFSSGTTDGLVNTGGTLTLAPGQLPTFEYTDPHASVPVLGDEVDGSGTYSFGTWTSPVYSMSFPFTELVSSWNATTTPGTWIQSEVMAQLNNGHWTRWYILGRWTYNDSDFHRTSVGGQGDADGFISVDTFFTKDHPAVAYRLRLTILRRAELTAAQAPVSVSRYSAIVSNLRNQRSTFPSETTMTGEPVEIGRASCRERVSSVV